jgi:hypothetical protein
MPPVCVTPADPWLSVLVCPPPPPAVREALAIVSEEGLESLWARHLAAHNQLWEGLSSMGLKPFVENEQDRWVGGRVGRWVGGCGVFGSLISVNVEHRWVQGTVYTLAVWGSSHL